MLARSSQSSSAFILQYKKYIQVSNRNVHVSVIGAASELGSNVALLLKLNSKVTHLQLYDDDIKVKGVGIELSYIPGGASVSAYAGVSNLGDSLRGSNIILMTTRTARTPGNSREKMMAANVPAVQSLCRAMVDQNPEAFLAISTNPINSIIPFACASLYKYNCYNPYKVFGVTHIDTARSRALAGTQLQINPRLLQIPVIGGHSDMTIIPLFSHIAPNNYSVDPCQAETLTRLVRRAGTEVVLLKQGTDSATLALAWSIHEFVDGLIDAVCGSEVVLNCFTANPHFGTRFFSGPTNVGASGILQTCSDLPMSDYESYLLNEAVPLINRDVSYGEEHVRYIEAVGK